METRLAALSRSELYERVWTDPVRAVAESFGVSDVWLKKCCAQADIPVPERGYWAKLKVGKPVIRVRLAPRGPGKADRVVIGKDPFQYRWPIDPEAELADPIPIEPVFSEAIESVEQRVRKTVGKVTLQRDLNSTHHLIRQLLADDEKRRLKPDGIPYRLRYSDPFFDSAFERRRLRILGSVFIGLAKAGCKPLLSGDQARGTSVQVGTMHVAFSLDHPTAKPNRHGEAQTRAGKADNLKLVINGSDLSWMDSDGDALESQLTEIVVQLVVAGEAAYRQNLQSAYVRACERRVKMTKLLAEQRAEAVRLDRERRLKEEEARRASLLSMASDLRAASDIRALVKTVLENTGDRDLEPGHVAKWSDWALAVADRTDPLNRLRFSATGEAHIQEPTLPEAGST